jgi:hypothetical protein
MRWTSGSMSAPASFSAAWAASMSSVETMIPVCRPGWNSPIGGVRFTVCS